MSKKIKLYRNKADQLAWKHMSLRLKLGIMGEMEWIYRHIGTDPDQVRDGIKREMRRIEKHPAWQGRQEWP